MVSMQQEIDIKDKVLKKIIDGRLSLSFEFLAANILVKHVQHLYSNEPNEDKLQAYCCRLRALLTQNANLPSVKKDLAKINSLEC